MQGEDTGNENEESTPSQPPHSARIVEAKDSTTTPQAKSDALPKSSKPKAPKEKPKKLPIKKQMEKSRASRKVPEKKVKEVKQLAEDMKSAKTIMIVSIKGVPSPQLQKIKKELRGKAVVKVVKKNILIRALDEAKVPEMLVLKEHVQADSAVALSNEDAFELAAWLAENRSPVAAKEGQEADEEINIEAGPTDLMPGPDISALGAVGLKVAVEEGKIAIKAPHTILKTGEKVTPEIAAVLQKLDIRPFMVGLNPAVIYDVEAKKIYVGVKIDKEQALTDLITAKGKAIGLAQKLGMITKDTIGYLLAKANAEMEKLKELAPKEPEKKEEPKAEEAKEEKPAKEELAETPAQTTEAQPKVDKEKTEELPKQDNTKSNKSEEESK